MAALQHRGDIADAAAAYLCLAKRVVDHPFVDRAGAGEIGRAVADDPVRGFPDDAAGGNEIGRGGVQRAVRSRQRRRVAGFRQVDGAVTDLDVAGDLDHRRLRLAPFGMHQRRAIMRVVFQRRLAVAGPLARARHEPRRFIDGGHRDPGLRLALGIRDLEPGDDLKFAPLAGLRGEAALRSGLARQGRCERQGRAGLEEFTAIEGHDRSPWLR